MVLKRVVNLSFIDTEVPITISEYLFMFFGSLFPVTLFLKFSNVELISFSKRIIGTAVLDLIDVNQRTLIYVFSAFLFFSLFVLWYLLIYQLEKKRREDSRIGIRNLGLELTCSLGILITIWQGFHPSNFQIMILGLLFIYGCLIVLINYLSSKYLLFSDKAFNFFSYNFLISTVFTGNVVFMLMFFQKFSIRFNRLYALLAIILVVFLFLLLQYLFRNRTAYYQRIVRSMLPLSALAGLIPLIQELQFTFAAAIPNLKILVFFVFLLVFVISMLLFFFKPTGNANPLCDFTKKLIVDLYIPLLIFTVLIYVLHNQYIVFGDLDYFHLGEALITNQQLFQFGKIPFLDIFPTYGLSNLSFQVLYSAINGYKRLEPYIWQWMSTIPLVLIFYYFLKRYIGVWYSLALSLLFPLDWILGSYSMFSGLYLVILCLHAIIISSFNEKYWYKHQLFYWLLNFFLVLLIFFWRLDFGLVDLIAFLTFLLCLIIAGQKNLDLRIDFRSLLMAFMIFLIIVAISGAILIQVTRTPFFEISRNLVDFLSMQGQSMGYSSISNSQHSLAYFEYFLTPIIGILYLLYFVYLLFSKVGKPSLKQFSLVFLAICSLGLSIRTLQRHSALELFYPAFTIVLTLLLPYYLNHKHTQSNYLFSLLLLALLIVGLSPIRKDSYTEKFLQRIMPGQGYDFVNWKPGDSRVILANGENQQTLTKYLKENLKEDQTFLDLTNRPLLYVLAEKEFPFYLIPVFNNSTEDIQQIETSKLQKLNDQELMPLTIVKGPPGFWFDRVDGVDNEIRNYRLFEFAYNNYSPYAEVDQNIIFKTKDLLPFSEQPVDSSTIMRSTLYQLRYLPYVWANFDPYLSLQNTPVQIDLSKQITTEGLMEPGTVYSFKITSKYDKSLGSYLDLGLSSGKNIVVSVCWDQTCKAGFEFVTQSGIDKHYLIRTSSDWFWKETDVDTIYIKVNGTVNLTSLRIRQGD